MPSLLIFALTVLISITPHAMSQNLSTSCKEDSVLIADSIDNKSIASCVTPYIAQKFIELGWVALNGNETLENLEDTDEASIGPICHVERLFVRRSCFLAKFDDELVFVITGVPFGVTPSTKLVRAAIFELSYESTGLEESKGTSHIYLSDPNQFFWSDGKTVIVAVGHGPLGGWNPEDLHSQ